MRKIFSVFTAILFISINCACFADSCQSSETIQEINFSLPKPTGKYGVGRQLTFLNDENRGREIAAWIYYPANVSKKSFEDSILPPKWAESYRNLLERKLGKSAANALLQTKSNAVTDADISSKESFPVLIFAPGLNWLPTDYSALIEEITSHGYIVIAFAAPPLSPVIQTSDGNIIQSPRSGDATYNVIAEDFRFIVNQLEKINQDNLKTKGRMNLNEIGVFGHSIGGAAAVLAATNEPKIKTAVNLDGDYAGESANAAPQQTILYITTEPPGIGDTPIEKWDESDRSETRRKGVWEKISANSKRAYRVRIAKMYHINFQDAALLPIDSMTENLRKNRFGAIDGKRGIDLINNILIQFFDSQLKSASLDNFAAIEKKYPEIRIETKP